jgi:hypothetical protein
MYRSSKVGNALAASPFERAIGRGDRLRAGLRGLSFTHFENAFQLALHAAGPRRLAQRHAETSLEHDPLDPLCNLVMGGSSGFAAT